MARPSKYDNIDLKQVYKLCLLGLTDVQLGDFLDVSEATINNWKIKYPKFLESIKKGKLIADAEVAKALLKKAKGFTRNVSKVFMGPEGPIEHDVEFYYPPDTAAAFIWLKNRQSKYWRDKTEVKTTGDKTNPTIIKLADGTEITV